MESSVPTVSTTHAKQALSGDFQSAKAAKHQAAKMLRLFPLSNSMILGASADQTYLLMVEVKNQIDEPVSVPLDCTIPLTTQEIVEISKAVSATLPGRNPTFCREIVMSEIASDKHSILPKAEKADDSSSSSKNKDANKE